MTGLRLRVCFENCPSLTDKYWILIDPARMRLVQDVVDHIQGKFSINCDKLVLADARLVENESVDILRETDIIQ